MEQIFPEGPKKLVPVSLLEAAEMMDSGKKEPFVLHPTDWTKECYERVPLAEYLKECAICVEE